MSYFSAFEISSSGMEVQKARLEVIAINLANVNTTRSQNGGVYQPKEVMIRESSGFNSMLSSYKTQFSGAEVAEIRPNMQSPRLIHNPGHPDADSKGMVSLPDINPVSQMVSLMEATRAYEANIQALNAAKAMTLKALEIGK